MFSKTCNALVFFIICFLTNSCTACSKEFRIYNNGESFDNQLLKIISEINSIPGDKTFTVNIDDGYFAIANTIEIKNCRHKINIIGSKNKSTIISGSIVVDDWEILPDGLWRAQIPSEVDKDYIPDQLYVNGVRAIRSRTPNNGKIVLFNGIKKDSLHGAVLRIEDLNVIPLILDSDIPILTIYRKWNSSKHFYNSYSESGATIFFTGADFPSCNKLKKGNGLIIENTKGGLDTPGEWCVDKSGYLYYFPKDGETIGQTEFRIPVIEKLLYIQSIEGLCIKNIVFEHTSLQIPDEGLEYDQAASSMSAAIEIDNTSNLSIENCEIRNVANYGIWLRYHCANLSVIKTFFHDLGAGAVKIGTVNQVKKNLTNNITIDNNIIYNYGQLMEEAVGVVLFNASNCKITHNDIHYGNYTGISLGWNWGFGDSPSKNNEVAFNKISHIGTGLLNDLGGVYTLGRSEGTYIHNNIVSDILSGNDDGWGIYADEGTTGIFVEKNLVYNTTSGGFFQHYGSDNTVSNNIFAWGKNSQVSFALTKGEKPLIFSHNIIIMKTGLLMSGDAIKSDMFDVSNNCYWTLSSELPKIDNIDINRWIEQKDTTSVFLEPKFCDPENYDFRLIDNSICKTIGFEEFDFTKAGVYGNRKWKKLAEELYWHQK